MEAGAVGSCQCFAKQRLDLAYHVASWGSEHIRPGWWCVRRPGPW